MKSVLVVCLDSELRNQLFALASERGFRVDAVADQRAMAKRLSKDEYVYLLAEAGLFDLSNLPDELTVVELAAGASRDHLESQLAILER